MAREYGFINVSSWNGLSVLLRRNVFPAVPQCSVSAESVFQK